MGGVEGGMMARLLEETIHNLALIYTGLRGKYPTILKCHPSTARMLKQELSFDINCQIMHIISYQGMRVVEDIAINPGVLFVDGE